MQQFNTQAPLGYLEFETQQIPYILLRSAKRRKTLELQVIHPHGIQLTAPKRWSIADIKRMVEDKKNWLLKEWVAQSRNTLHFPNNWVTGEKISYLGEEYILDVLPAKRTTCELNKPFLKITVAKPEICIKKTLLKWLKQRAEIILKERCDDYAQKMQLIYTKLSVANQKSRWGSCSENSELRFNWRLVLLPMDIIDYVVVHELAHLVHLNHKPVFWKLVARYAPNYLQQRKALRQVSIGRFN